MRYLLVPFENWGYYEKLIPKEISDTLDKNDSMMVGAVDDETREPCGVIVFTVSEDVFNQVVYMQLDWLYVREDLRNQGIGSSFYGYMEYACRASNISSVRFNLKEEYETGVLLYFLNKRLSGISLKYYGLYQTKLGLLQENAFIKEILSIKTEGKVYPVSTSLIRENMTELQKMMDNGKLYEGIKAGQILDTVIDEKFNADNGIGYIYGDVLAGLMLVEEITDSRVAVRYLTFHKDYGVLAAATIISAFVKAASKWYGKDLEIMLESHNKYTDGLMAIIIPGIERINVYDAKIAG